MNAPHNLGASPGLVFDWPRAYDLLLKLVWGRSERRYRDRVVELASLCASQAVLDVGCGTGTQALAVARSVGPSGRTVGVDASPAMVARARAKAGALGLDIEFIEAAAEALPFPEATFDAVLSTTVIHCLPEAQRFSCLREMARVLKPGGRLLLVDFGGSSASRHSLFGHMRVHRRFDLRAIVPQLAEAGLGVLETGQLGFSDLAFVVALRDDAVHRRPAPAHAALFNPASSPRNGQEPPPRGNPSGSGRA